jgi:peptidoglycan hydrolase CwlO-like protein
MPTLEDRVIVLELQVEHLATWAGPGQADALSSSLHQTRAGLANIQRTQDKHTRQLSSLVKSVASLTGEVNVLKDDVAVLKSDVAVLKSDVAVLKDDMAEVKGAVREILRRLPSAA